MREDDWISVDERLPEVDEEVLVYRKKTNPKIQYLKWWAGDHQEFTHWSRVPPPKQKDPNQPDLFEETK